MDRWIGDAPDAVAEGGEANRAVIKLLAKSLGVSKSAIRLRSGATSRLKQVVISGDPAALDVALAKLTSDKTD